MAENLDYDVPGNTELDDVCYNKDAENCKKYGRLYNWATAMGGASSANPSGVRGVCPEGWHLPSDAEWTALTNAIGSSTAGTKLKAKEGWNSCSASGSTYTCSDDYGFSALPGGFGFPNGTFNTVGDRGYWWSATEGSASFAWSQYISNSDTYLYRNSGDRTRLFSVRCVQD